MQRTEYEHANRKYHHRFLDEHFKELPITRAEAPYLGIIIKSGNRILMNDLIAGLFYHKSHATRAINKMVDDGLIVKEKNQDDLRGYVLSLTEEGKKVAKQVHNIFEEWEALVNTVITDEERVVLNNISRKIHHLLSEYYGEEDTTIENNI